jgi:hypothetical protein
VKVLKEADTFRNSALFQDKFLLTDLFADSCNLFTHDSSPEIADNKVIKHYSSFTRVTYISLSEGFYSYTTPFFEKGKFLVQLETEEGLYTLKSGSQYSMWAWVRAIQDSYKYWHKSENPPDWPNGIFRASLEVCSNTSLLI